jgi:hypothetical protein
MIPRGSTYLLLVQACADLRPSRDECPATMMRLLWVFTSRKFTCGSISSTTKKHCPVVFLYSAFLSC